MKVYFELALTGWQTLLFLLEVLFYCFLWHLDFLVLRLGSQRTSVEFFPDNKPNQIIVYIEYPQGTDIEKTNAITKDIEKRVYAVLNDEVYKDEWI